MKETISHGSYAASNPVLSFDDTLAVIAEDGFFRERKMVLEGKTFKIRSFFRPVSSESATDKLLRLIDMEQNR